MYLIVGATGRLGSAVTRQLLAQDKPVRAMTRTPAKVDDLKRLGAEIVEGDLRDPDSLTRACKGVEKVLAAAHGFPGQGDNNPHTVDAAGNRHLIHAAQAVGVKHFVFVSILGAQPDHSMLLSRIKYGVEEYLRASGLNFTILRSAAFMEFWAALVGQPILEQGETTIFGRGENPINFVAVDDVTRFALVALDDPKARNQVIEVGGPQNLTFNQVAEIFEKVAGRAAKKKHVPLPMMRVMASLMRPFNPAMALQISAGISMDTADLTFDMTNTLKLYPMELTRLEEVARRSTTDARD